MHRYHISSPERVVAIVTRGGDAPGTLHLHADHLGTVDAVTGEAGSVEERRSYDAFGQRRNPVWGDPPPAVFAPTTSLGEPDKPPILPIRVVEQTNDDGSMDVLLIYPPRVHPPADGAPQLLAIVPSNDMDTTGSDVPQPPPDASDTPETPPSWKENPYVQIESGFSAGLALGLVPFGGAAHQVLDETKVIPHGTPLMNRGLAVGQIIAASSRWWAAPPARSWAAPRR